MEKVDLPVTECVAFLLCTSHRARDKLQRVIGRDRQGYFATAAFGGGGPTHHGIFPVTADELTRTAGITGVRKTRLTRAEISPCWSME